MIVAGLGCRAGVPLASVQDLLADLRPDALAVLDMRAQEAAVQALGLPLIVIAPDAIAEITTPTQSPRILARFATGCVAEALALVAAGPGACITRERRISADGMATLAIARSSEESLS